jgi:two-component system sensor histidine kinase LytS
MYLNLFLQLTSHMSFIAMTAYFIGRNRFIIHCAQYPFQARSWITLSIAFSLLSIIGTYTGIPIEGALANTRMVGTLMSGFMGGPLVGLCTGLISGTHRFFLGGFTGDICAIATVLGGLFAGLVRQKYGLNHLTWKTGALVALIAEVAQKTMIISFAKPFATAWALEAIIAIPTTLVTVLGTVVFMLITENIKAEQDNYGATAAEVSLEIASRTLPYLRHGLTTDSAQKTAEIIFKLTKVASVSITDREVVLAYIGLGDDHHKVSQPIMTSSTKRTIKEGQVLISSSQEERGCPVENCPLHSGVVAPLTAHGMTIGTIKLSKQDDHDIGELDLRMIDGIAKLLSIQIQLAEIDEQRIMREKAELKALQAQINPHFLFNTISIIMSLCRTDPATARNLLGHLATLMQRSFSSHRDFITIREELQAVEAYLEIAKCRFGSRLTVTMNIDPATLDYSIPLLSIQPLVENALRHGLFPKLSDCKLAITITCGKTEIIIKVSDNGVGIPAARLQCVLHAEADGIGIENVNSRMTSIYGSNYPIIIDSKENKGTDVTLRIPTEGRSQYAV